MPRQMLRGRRELLGQTEASARWGRLLLYGRTFTASVVLFCFCKFRSPLRKTALYGGTLDRGPGVGEAGRRYWLADVGRNDKSFY
jgi:hypothetical protein